MIMKEKEGIRNKRPGMCKRHIELSVLLSYFLFLIPYFSFYLEPISSFLESGSVFASNCALSASRINSDR